MSQEYKVDLNIDIAKAKATVNSLNKSITALKTNAAKALSGKAATAAQEVAYSYNAADIQCQRWANTMKTKIAQSYQYADAAAQQHAKTLKQQVALSYQYADAEAQQYRKTLQKDVAASYAAADAQCERWTKTLNQKQSAALAASNAKLKQQAKLLRYDVAESYARADAESKAYYANTKKRITELGTTKFGKLTSGQIQVIETEVSKLNKSLAGMRNNMSDKEYQMFASHLDRASVSLRTLKQNADFGYSALRKFWERFGKVALGFSVMYTGIRLVSAGFMEFTQILTDGVKQAGEMVALQAKMAMWASLASDGMLSYTDAFEQARGQTEALADASVTAVASLDELSAAYDELGQTAVGLPEDMIPGFTSLVDFTILIAKTTDSSMKQVRQELQALLSGQVRTTNVLIRTAKHLGMISEEDIQNLKEQKNSYEIIVKLIKQIDSAWGEAKQKLIMADVNTGMKMWYDTLVRIVSKSEELASKETGVQSIFGATAYEHFDRLQKKLQGLGTEYTGAMQALNAGFDTTLTLVEQLIDKLMQGVSTLWDMRDALTPLLSIAGAGITGKAIGSLLGMPGVGTIVALVAAVNELIKSLTDLNFIGLVLTKTFDGLGKIWDLFSNVAKGRVGFGGKLTETGIYTASFEELQNEARKTAARIQEINASIVDTGTVTRAQKEELQTLSTYLQEVQKRASFLKEHMVEAKESLKAFFKETKSVSGMLEELKFDPFKALTQAASEGDVGTVSMLKNLAKQQIEVNKAMLVNQLNTAKQMKQSPQQQALITALTITIAQYDKQLKSVNDAEQKALDVRKAQLQPITALRTKYEELTATLNGSLGEYNKQKTIQETIAAVSKNTGGVVTKAQKLEIAYLVETIAKMEEKISRQKEWLSLYDAQAAENAAIDKARISSTADLQKQFYQDLYNAQTTEEQRARYALTEKLNTYRNTLQAMGVAEEDFNTLRDKLWADFDKKYKKQQQSWLSAVTDGLDAAAKDIGYTYDNIKDTVKSAFSGMTEALTDFVVTGKSSFSDLVNSIISDIVRMQIETSVTKPLSEGFSGLMSSWFGMTSNAKGGVYNSPSLHSYTNTVQTTPKLFTFAQGGVFAEAGPEAIMPLERNEQGELGVKASASNVTVNVINESGTPMQVTRQEQSFDLQGEIITLWIDGFQRNKSNLRTMLGG
jgi:lambda family phage tail tape measure protein